MLGARLKPLVNPRYRDANRLVTGLQPPSVLVLLSALALLQGCNGLKRAFGCGVWQSGILQPNQGGISQGDYMIRSLWLARPRMSVVACSVVLLQGCASMFTGTRDTLAFDANVPGVRLSIDGRFEGETPLTIDMSRNFVGGRKFLARFEKEGYVTQQFELNREFNAVAILDVSSTIVSGGVDVLTGAIMKFSPRDYHVQMLAEGRSVRSKEYQRDLELYRFALGNSARLQKDIARGGGEALRAFAWLIAAGDGVRARLICDRSFENAEELAGAGEAQPFVHRFNRMLAIDPVLRGLQLE